MSQLVLDMACGSRAFWFDKNDPRAVFVDKRRERHTLKDRDKPTGVRMLVIEPTIQADFAHLPFVKNSFPVVIFDPPHLIRNGRSGWLAAKYGKLGKDWREMLSAGFAEAFRVLRPAGILIFKWNERDIPVSKIVALTPHKPLIGSKLGKSAQSHWIVFMKPDHEQLDGGQGPGNT